MARQQLVGGAARDGNEDRRFHGTRMERALDASPALRQSILDKYNYGIEQAARLKSPMRRDGTSHVARDTIRGCNTEPSELEFLHGLEGATRRSGEPFRP